MCISVLFNQNICVGYNTAFLLSIFRRRSGYKNAYYPFNIRGQSPNVQKHWIIAHL